MKTYLRLNRYAGIAAVTACAWLAGCSFMPGMGGVLPDNRDDYQKSETLPPLEVPPDLIAAEKSSSMSIPGEEGVSMSDYRRQGRNTAATTATTEREPPDQWVSVSGTKSDVWPRLVDFFSERGHDLRLNDMETGILTTEWSEADDDTRDRYRIFSEPGAQADVTVLFISNERQQRSGDGQWVDQGSDSGAEETLAGELNVYLNGSSASATTGP